MSRRLIFLVNDESGCFKPVLFSREELSKLEISTSKQRGEHLLRTISPGTAFI